MLRLIIGRISRDIAVKREGKIYLVFVLFVNDKITQGGVYGFMPHL